MSNNKREAAAGNEAPKIMLFLDIRPTHTGLIAVRIDDLDELEEFMSGDIMPHLSMKDNKTLCAELKQLRDKNGEGEGS